MFRPMHFILFFAAIAFVVATPVPGDADVGRVPEPRHAEETADTLDLEPSASGWGYVQPYYGRQYGWNRGNGWYGRSQGWNGGNGWYGRSQGWYGRGSGWW